MTESPERKELLNLDEKRKALEEEASVITDELMTAVDGKEPMGISTPLVDEEGYPRADIDVYRARHLRKRLNEIKYDHDVIMKKIEQEMLKIESNDKEAERIARQSRKPKPKFDTVSGKWVCSNFDGTVAGIENGHLRSFNDIGKENEVEDMSQKIIENANIEEKVEMEEILRAFAKIELVSLDSPAQEAGLKKDDLILKFGSVDYSNNRQLRALGEIVQNSYADGSSITIRVSRNDKTLSLKLSPQQWSGRGLVGCTFSPVL